MLPAAPHLACLRLGGTTPMRARGLLSAAAKLLPALLTGSPWFALAIAGVGPLTELLGPRLAIGLGRARLAASLRAPDPPAALPAPLIELVQTRALLASLSRLASERLLALDQRLNPLETQARPRSEDLTACEALTRECLHAWHDLDRAATRFSAAHRRLADFLAERRDQLAPPALAELSDAVAVLLRFFDRVQQNQQLRARRLLLHAGLLARHAARRGVALCPALREALRDLAARVASEANPLPYVPLGTCQFDR